MRRSSRLVTLEKKAEKDKETQEKIETGSEDGLAVIDCGKKGRGVGATKPFLKGDYVCQYFGDLISQKEALKRLGYFVFFLEIRY